MRSPIQSRGILALAAAGLAGITLSPAVAQGPGGLPGLPVGVAPRSAAKQIEPERELLGIRLGRQYLEVLRRFRAPNEIQTVALINPTENLPPLGGGGAMGGIGGDMAGGLGALGGAPYGGGAYGGSSSAGAFGAPGPMGAGGPYGGRPGGGGLIGAGPMGGGGLAGPGTLGAPPGFGGSGGAGLGGAPSFGDAGDSGDMMGGMGAAGGLGAGGAGGTQLPEYSAATLWIYKRDDQQRGKQTVRLEFLINEDGKVAQISVAAPARKTYPGVRTAQNITLGTGYQRVLESYGYPERTRLLPGFRFMEAYFTKNHHAAFTFDMTEPSLPCVRITIALAD